MHFVITEVFFDDINSVCLIVCLFVLCILPGKKINVAQIDRGLLELIYVQYTEDLSFHVVYPRRLRCKKKSRIINVMVFVHRFV